jgi:hypothetical protein
MRHQRVFQVALSVSICLGNLLSYAALPTNSVNDGRIIQGGTYGNTADNVTTFKNSTGGGLWLQAGQNLRGVEVDTAGNLTNNGGNFHLFAPGQVVRVDGNIDVRGIQGSSGAFLGNGGRVFIDSAYLFQNGNIFASGLNGGLVQMNVGSMAMGPTARISALGYGGQGGVVSLNASGTVDLQRGSVIDTSGKVSGTFDTNVINIEGGVVNVEGTLQASGVQARGGTIRLVATGQTDLTQAQDAIADSQTAGTITSADAQVLNTRMTTLKNNYEGSIRIASGNSTERQAIVSAQGMPGTAVSTGNDIADPEARTGDGGTIILTAQNRILNGGWLLADGAKGMPNAGGNPTNGGNGGTISLNVGSEIITSGRIVANAGVGSTSSTAVEGGKGGDAGLIAFNYRNGLSNTGSILALGGNGGQGLNSPAPGGMGGLIVFSGPGAPAGNGNVFTYGGSGSTSGFLGSIITSEPAPPDNHWIGVWRNLQRIEMVHNAENLLILNRGDFSGEDANNLPGWTYNAQVRSVRDQAGVAARVRSGAALQEMNAKLLRADEPNTKPYLFRNLIFSATNTRYLSFDPRQMNRADGTTLRDFPFNTMTLLGNSPIDFLTTNNVQPNREAFGGGLGGGHLSIITPALNISNAVISGGIAGGSVNVATSNLLTFKGISQVGQLHGGSVILKAGTDLRTNPDSGATGGALSNGLLMGGTQQLFAGQNVRSSADIIANGRQSGGSISIMAGNQIVNTAAIQAIGSRDDGYIRLSAMSITNNGKIDNKSTTQSTQPSSAIKPD